MDSKTRNLELETWLIETTGEEMMANHLGPNWNRFNDEFGFYPNMSMTIADLVWQHQQAKVEGLQKRIDKAIEAINDHYDSDGMSGLYFMDIKEILEGEQALKGEG